MFLNPCVQYLPSVIWFFSSCNLQFLLPLHMNFFLVTCPFKFQPYFIKFMVFWVQILRTYNFFRIQWNIDILNGDWFLGKPTSHRELFGSLYFICCRSTKDIPRFKDELDTMKFVCKDVWSVIYKKQIDNLRTNHHGVYNLHDYK